MKLTTFDMFKKLPDNAELVELSADDLQHLQDVMLCMLGDIMDFCDEQGIEYQLCGGTALGAARHDGFIPWDDDLDISLPRSEYDRFIPAFRERFGDAYWVHDPQTTHDYGLGFARVRKKGTVMRNRDDYLLDECGICIDVFPIENVPDNALLRMFHGVGSLALGYLLSCRKFAEFAGHYMALAAGVPEIEKTFKMKIRIGSLMRFVSLDTVCHAADNWNAMCKNDNSEYVTNPTGRHYYFGEMQPRAVFYPSSIASFAGRLVKVPHDLNAYLTHLFSDWHQLPAPQDREKHLLYELDFGS